MLKASELMIKRAQTLKPSDHLTYAVDQILASGLTGLPVTDEAGHLVGFLSEQDCVRQLTNSSYHCDAWVRISDIMSRQPLTVTADQSLLELAARFGDAKPKVYPVVDSRHRVIGIVTRARVMDALNHSLKTCRAA